MARTLGFPPVCKRVASANLLVVSLGILSWTSKQPIKGGAIIRGLGSQ